MMQQASVPPNLPSHSQNPGRPKDLSKRAAILEAAKTLFSQEGFAGVSMDRIAAKAAVSKLTVYSHFGDKESLFFESIRALCEESLPEDAFRFEEGNSLRGQLRNIAEQFFSLITSDEAIYTHRMMFAAGQVGHADQKLRQIFWEAGPQRAHRIIATFLMNGIKSGQLVIDDVNCAAKQFSSLLKGESYRRLICGVCDTLPKDEINDHIDATVDMFLRAYARR